jgi:tetrapyrrole methylase family protein/MazG family protein
MENFDKFFEVIKRLRGPGGCPWDIEQTPQSIRGNLLEESYELVEAINAGDEAHICEELGDVYLVATMLAYMHEQSGAFSVAQMFDEVTAKLIRRHPHVFGDANAADSDEVLKNWSKIKVEQEGRAPKDSILDEVSQALPALQRAVKLQKKAAKAGFDWKDASEIFSKIEEEVGEVHSALQAVKLLKFAKSKTPANDAAAIDAANSDLENELGDLLFSVVNLCRHLKIDPDLAIQRTNVKFTRRFKYIEAQMKERDWELTPEKSAIMEVFWEDAKKSEK